jgi:hypothetical protein
MTSAVVCLVLIAIVVVVRADVYMHNPRDSNNHNCETNQNSANDNHLFESQNNATRGYPCPRDTYGNGIATPRMYYYQGSVLPIEWTSQHSCGYRNNDCQIIIQFACNVTLKSKFVMVPQLPAPMLSLTLLLQVLTPILITVSTKVWITI